MTTTVRQLLNSKTSEIFSVSPETMVIDAIKMMNEKKVGALLVTEGKKIRGILSERDYTRKVILNNRSSSDTPVSEIMTSEVLYVTPDQTIDDCMVVMSDNHIRHLPVVENCESIGGCEAIGILSIMDVVKNIISEKEFIIEQLENYITDCH